MSPPSSFHFILLDVYFCCIHDFVTDCSLIRQQQDVVTNGFTCGAVARAAMLCQNRADRSGWENDLNGERGQFMAIAAAPAAIRIK